MRDATPSLSSWREHRSFARAPLHMAVQLQHAAGPQLGRIRDLSLGGLGAEVEDPPPPGSHVNVALELGELGRLDLVSVVKRIDDVVGLQFDGLSGDELTALRMFLGRQQPAA